MNQVGSRGHTTRWVAAAVGAVLMLTLTACSGSSKPAAPTTGATTTTAAKRAPKPVATTTTAAKSAVTTTTLPSSAADKATASALSFTQSDFPAGWVGTPHQVDPADAQTNEEIAACVGGSDPSKQTADVDSPDFNNGNAEVSSDVSIAPSRAAFEQDVTALRSTKYEACVKKLSDTELRAEITKGSPGVKLGAITLTRITTPTYGEVTVGLRLSATVTDPTGASLRLYIDSVEYGQNRSEVSLTFTSENAPFAPALERALVAKVAAKLKTLGA